jgi:hypothetical protein
LTNYLLEFQTAEGELIRTADYTSSTGPFTVGMRVVDDYGLWVVKEVDPPRIMLVPAEA